MNRTTLLQDRRMEKFEELLRRWDRGELSGSEAGELLGCSERQFRRYRRRYEEDGLEGLADRRLGKASARRIAVDEVMWMVGQYESHYLGWNVKHFHEHLQARHGVRWSYSWVKTKLQAADLVPRLRRRGTHRRKRERKPCEGMMLHQDGSRAVWLAGQPALDLIVTMDDATSTLYSALLVEEEGTASTFRGLLEVFESKGLPLSFYTDRGSHYFVTVKAGETVDRGRLTQVGWALKRLGIEHIAAYSPQARGRSERMFGTLQDRLIKELAQAGIRDIEIANRWLREVYLPAHNRRFARPPAVAQSAFVAAPDRIALVEALCVQEERVVERDNTVSWRKLKLQLPDSPLRHHWVKARVRVHQYPDGQLALFHGPACIARYDALGRPHGADPTTGRATPCSAPPRDGLASATGVATTPRRPPLTAPARGVARQAQAETGKTSPRPAKKDAAKRPPIAAPAG
ncbi:MAG TPA: ISNCY family transposase [Reyranella sp.]|nr:ISNCY family transposase [Reyranella sp.]